MASFIPFYYFCECIHEPEAIMWTNNLRIAWRTLRKHKGYGAISIVGLSLAIFAYRVEVSVWMLAGVGLAALLVAGQAVSYQTVTASRTNPAAALRHE